MLFVQPPDADPAFSMPSEPNKRIAFFGRDLTVMFGATDYFAPIRLRLFHTEGRRLIGWAYRIAPDPDGGELWTPDGFREADPGEAAEHIPCDPHCRRRVPDRLGGRGR